MGAVLCHFSTTHFLLGFAVCRYACTLFQLYVVICSKYQNHDSYRFLNPHSLTHYVITSKTFSVHTFNQRKCSVTYEEASLCSLSIIVNLKGFRMYEGFSVKNKTQAPLCSLAHILTGSFLNSQKYNREKEMHCQGRTLLSSLCCT